MIEVEHRSPGVRTKTIWFSERPFDIDNVDSVNFLSCKEKVEAEGFAREDLATIVLDLRRGEETIWKNMNKRYRMEIRRAMREGVEVTTNSDHQAFLRMNEDFRTSKNLPPYSYSEDFMRKNGTLFISKCQGEMLGGAFFLHDDRNMLGMFSASIRLNVHEDVKNNIASSNRLLKWEAIRYGLENGLENFDTWRLLCRASRSRDGWHKHVQKTVLEVRSSGTTAIERTIT